MGPSSSTVTTPTRGMVGDATEGASTGRRIVIRPRAGSDDGARRSAGSPPPARARRLHVAWPWRVVFERLMGAHRIVVAEVGTQEPAKMGLTENHEVIQAVPVTNLIRERA